MNAEIYISPQLDELARKREELALLESVLADRELSLANLRAELAAFEGRYLRQIGVLYAELDDWTARLAELAAADAGTPQAQSAAAQARAQAQDSYAASHGEASTAEEFWPQPELKKLFREVCNQVHPDRAATEPDRDLREKLMAQANAAYKRQDADALRRVLEEYKFRPDAAPGGGSAAERERVIRQIQRITRRLGEIEAEIAALTSAEIAKLMAKVQGEAAKGRDLMDEMARSIRMRIEQAREEFQEHAATERVR
jgi:pyruvate/2-oxoglutarate dehydrogenase complex dihydrolipoamide acyltransferase (E2) component